MTTPITGGRTSAMPLRAERGGTSDEFEPSGEVTSGAADGITVDAHRTLRHVGTGLGVTLALAGTGLLVARGMRADSVLSTVPNLLPAAIGAATVGGVMTVGSLAGLRAKTQEYSQVVEGSLREAGASADRLGGDVGIVAAGDGRWGLLPLADAVADEEGAGAAKLSNPPIRFAALTSRDGDTWVRRGEEFVNRGAASAIDARSIDPTDAAAVRSLVGAQVAVGQGGSAVVKLGEPLLGGAPAASRQELVSTLFEAGIENAALVDTGRGVLAFAVGGATSADGLLFARGTGVSPVGAISLLSDVSNGPATRTPFVDRQCARGRQHRSTAARRRHGQAH